MMNTISDKKTIIGMVVVITLVFSAGLHAKKDDNRAPLGCHDTGYKKELKILKLLPSEAGEQNSMYFVHNKLPETVTLYHMKEGRNFFGIHLNHKILPDRWAVFSTNEKQVKFICTTKDKKLDYGRVIDCKDALKVCEYTKVKFGLNNRGNLWIVNSNTRNGAVREVVRYGIIPAY